MRMVPNRKDTQQATLVVFFQYRPYRKGARKAPARAPQDTPMSWAMKLMECLYWTMAMIMEITTKTTMKQRMMNTASLSSIFLMMLPRSRSMVRVEEDAMTREDRVDMEADRTRTTTTAMRISGRPESMVGMIES